MPKEIIHDPTALAGTSDQSTQFAVEVAWGRETHVQIATIDLQKDSFTSDRGYYVDLRREDINKIIRTLRKARDQAYGADE